MIKSLLCNHQLPILNTGESIFSREGKPMAVIITTKMLSHGKLNAGFFAQTVESLMTALKLLLRNPLRIKSYFKLHWPVIITS